MDNLEFSVPFNQDTETLREIVNLKSWGGNRIREIYLSGPQEYSGSGRVASRINLDQTIELINQIHKENIRVNLCMNSTCEGSDWYLTEVVKSKLEYLRQMHEEHGVEAVTIANPLYIKEVRKILPDIEICASVLSGIDCVQQAVLYARAGANVITPDVNINRNLKLLKEIKDVANVELRLMVNEGCMYKCPFRRFHFNYVSHRSIEQGTSKMDGVFFANCQQVIRKDHSQILKSCWIRPEDTRKYSEITNYFKIVGRARPKSFVIRSIKAYLKESWDGDLLDILSSSLNLFTLQEFAHLDNKSLEGYKFFETVT
ncbi:MAG: U32 family peptidase, partial [Dehalococcoidales bacterium]|nr:U32 family peptidase [Dehalococcoidales bacterium]